MAVAGAIIGATIGGWLNDKFGRRSAILIADFLFFVGGVVMASTMNSALLIVGRVFVGLGVGMASMTAPLYILEASPTKIRGALVSTNEFLITGGLFLSYLINLAFSKSTRYWEMDAWSSRITSPSAVHINASSSGITSLDYRKGRQEEAKTILRKIYSPEKVEVEIQDIKESIDKESEENKAFEKINLFKLCQIVCRGLIAGVGLQIFHQFVGINTVMYYIPTIIQLAGIASNRTTLPLSLVTAGLNAFGSIVSIYFIYRTGRKKLLIISLCGVVMSL
ncbi:hypothetical protein P3S67_029533 [Capsicum chacoense]